MFTMIPYRRALTKPARSFEPFLNDPFFHSFFTGSENLMTSTFKVDIKEVENAFVIEAEMPGLEENQINLEVDEGILTINADYQSQTSKEEDGRVYSERMSGHMQRSFNLDKVDQENITANYKNGILYVNLPKMQAVEKTVRKIPVLMEGSKSAAE